MSITTLIGEPLLGCRPCQHGYRTSGIWQAATSRDRVWRSASAIITIVSPELKP